MRNTQRRPLTVGEMLTAEFLEPMEIDIRTLAEAMGVHRNTLSRIVHDKGTLTAPMAIKLAAALGNTPSSGSTSSMLWSSGMCAIVPTRRMPRAYAA
ncbi:HigA family addiction module antitoxin [Cobetia marina]